MRKVVTLQVEKPRIGPEEIKQAIERIVSLFDQYLDEYPVKGGRSKHALMGPVAKVLERAGTGQWEAEALTGFALRVHEMNRLSAGRVSQRAVRRLLDGTSELLTLCRVVPVTALTSTLEQVEYNVYFRRWQKNREWLERQQADLRQFLSERYSGDDTAFAQAWRLAKGSRIGDQYFFGSGSRTYKQGTEMLRTDMDEFYRQMAARGDTPEQAIVDVEEE